jgi:hypothetical protein
MQRIGVKVFPIEPDRWIAVIDAPEGPFSTEAVTLGQVAASRLTRLTVIGVR